MPTIDDAFQQANVKGYLHAIDIDSGAEVSHNADEVVVTASVFKLPVLLEMFRQASAGELDIRTPVDVPTPRTLGPTGLSLTFDPITMSLRDLGWLMMCVSDNAATDLICERVGLDNVNKTLRGLGHSVTTVEVDCAGIFETMVQDCGLASVEDYPATPPDDMIAKMRANRGPETDRSTPREMATLLAQIWRDEAAPADACAEVRRVLGGQVWPHRLASGFPEPGIRTSGKTGTIVTWKNECGVVEFDSGRRFAVAVFTEASTGLLKNPPVDAAIGKAARAAVDLLL